MNDRLYESTKLYDQALGEKEEFRKRFEQNVKQNQLVENERDFYENKCHSMMPEFLRLKDLERLEKERDSIEGRIKEI